MLQCLEAGLLAGSRHVLWLATEAVGINEVTVAVRGFAKHWTCSRVGQRRGTPGRLLWMVFLGLTPLFTFAFASLPPPP